MTSPRQSMFERRSAAAFASLVLLAAGCSGGRALSPLPAQNAASDTPIEMSVPAVSPARGDDWPTFARNVERQGYEALPTGITAQNVSTLVSKWVFATTNGANFQASPIVVNGVLYAVDQKGVVYALDAVTGAQKWTYTIPDSDDVKMTPALYDGVLFVASFELGYGKIPYHFTALDPRTGRQLWTQPVPGPVHGSPVAIDGVIYVPVAGGDRGLCKPGGVYAFDEKTGTPVGTPWLTEPVTPSDGGGIWSPLSYDGKQLYYGTGNTCYNVVDRANSIVALTPQGGANWHVNTANSLLDYDVASGVLRVGDSAVAIGKNGILYRLNAVTGQVVWARSLGAPPGSGAFASPTFYGSGTSNATIIVGGGYRRNPDTTPWPPGGMLYGLTAGGTVRWQVASNEPVLGYVAVTPDLAFTPIDTNMDALDPLTGKVLWTFPAAGYFYASPVVVPSGLFFADETGHVYAFGLPSSGPAQRSALTRAAVLALQRRKPPQPHRRPKFCKLN